MKVQAEFLATFQKFQLQLFHRVEVLDGGLVTFVPVKVNLNLKTETVDELKEKKKPSLVSVAFEVFRRNTFLFLYFSARP